MANGGFLIYRVIGKHVLGPSSGRMVGFQLMEPKIQLDWYENTWQKMLDKFYEENPNAIVFSCEKVLKVHDKQDLVLLHNVYYNKDVVNIRPSDVVGRLPLGKSFDQVVVPCEASFFSESLGSNLDSVEDPLTLEQQRIIDELKRKEDANKE